MNNVKHLGQTPDGAILVTANVVGIYLNIPHKAVLETIKRRFIDTSEITSGMLTGDTVHITEFVLKNNFFEFNEEFKRQKSGSSIHTKFASLRACILMDKVETEFLKSQQLKPFLCLHYIEDIFYIWNLGTQELDSFLNELNKFHPNLRFTYETSKERIKLSDLNVS